jgi:hypothetical protein
MQAEILLSLGALCLLGGCSATFALVIFEIFGYFCGLVLASLDHSLPICASRIAGITGMYHHTQLFIA